MVILGVCFSYLYSLLYLIWQCLAAAVSFMIHQSYPISARVFLASFLNTHTLALSHSSSILALLACFLGHPLCVLLVACTATMELFISFTCACYIQPRQMDTWPDELLLMNERMWSLLMLAVIERFCKKREKG